ERGRCGSSGFVYCRSRPELETARATTTTLSPSSSRVDERQTRVWRPAVVSRGAGRPCCWVVWAPPALDSHGVQSPCSSRCRPSFERVKNRELQILLPVWENTER